MSKALRINTNSRSCVVPIEDVLRIARELRKLLAHAYPSAANAATILEAAAAEETTADVTLTPDEEAAVGRVLDGMDVEGGRLPDGLQELWDGIRIDSGSI